MVTVGICDDEKQQRTMLRRIAESYFQLLGEEYKVEEYEGGESLLQKIQQDPYGTDIIIAKRYEGNMEVEYTEKEFVLFLYLRLE